MSKTSIEHLMATLDTMLDTYTLADVFRALRTVCDLRAEKGDRDEFWDLVYASLDALVDMAGAGERDDL
jgi:hypothetical protein